MSTRVIPRWRCSTTHSREEIDEAIRNNVSYFAGLPHIHEVEIVEFWTGHWPQFSKPEGLAAHILAALRHAESAGPIGRTQHPLNLKAR